MRAACISTILLLNLSVLLSSSLLFSLSSYLPAGAAAGPEPLLVAAAADLARTQLSLSESFAKTTGLSVRFALGSSGMLARQVENGAPYDVYLSANEEFVRNLTNTRTIAPDSVVIYAYGRLGLWSRTGRFRKLEDLLDPGVRHVAIANPLHAPYGMAAREALRRRGLWEKLEKKLVYGENVQQAFQFAESGNADAVITAWSLIYDRGGVALPADWHDPIRQVGGAVAGRPNTAAARRFLRFLAGPEGRKVLEKAGFAPPG